MITPVTARASNIERGRAALQQQFESSHIEACLQKHSSPIASVGSLGRFASRRELYEPHPLDLPWPNPGCRQGFGAGPRFLFRQQEADSDLNPKRPVDFHSEKTATLVSVVYFKGGSILHKS